MFNFFFFLSSWKNLLQFKVDKSFIPSLVSSDDDCLIFKGSAMKTWPSFAGLHTFMNPHFITTAFVYASVVLD